MSVVERVKTYIGAYSDTDIRALLHEDHRQIRELTERMSSDEAKPERVRAFERLKLLLTAHSRAEERAVYAPLVALRQSREARAAGNEGFVEHSLVDVLIERLGKTELAATDAWKAHAEVLTEMLDHHIDEDERGMFASLGEHFDDEQRAAIGSDFVARKENLLRNNGGDSERGA